MDNYNPDWRSQALREGKDQNSAEFASMRDAEAMLKPDGWRQVALNRGVDQNNPEALAAAGIGPDMGGYGAGGGGVGSMFGDTASTGVLNLPDLYKNLTASSGIAEIEKGITDKTNAYNDAQAKINDNPFLSEASRVGRVQKLTTDFNNSIKTAQDSLTMKKQDIATQLDLQTKQFDINSQTAKMALDKFNTLLSSGALAGASGNDIAAITRATGISSTMIQSAIGAQKQKDMKTSVSTVDDGKNQYSVVIDSNTGRIISKEIIAASKPEKVAAGETKTKVTTDINTDYGKYINNEVITINGKTGPAQKLMSPEDFYKLMVRNYPTEVAAIPSPTDIRKITEPGSVKPSAAQQLINSLGGQ